MALSALLSRPVHLISRMSKLTIARLSMWPVVFAWLIIMLVCATLWYRYPAAVAYEQAGAPGDFAIYLEAWDHVTAGVSPYLGPHLDPDTAPYKYSPGVLSLIGLLPAFSPSSAWFVFGSLSSFFFGVALFFGSRYRSWREVVALLVGLALGWKGVMAALAYGKLDLLFFGLAVLSLFLLRSAPALAGFLAGTLPWFKLSWALLLLPLLIVLISRKNRKLPRFFSAYFGAWFLWGAAVPALVFGTDRALRLSQDWISLLRSQPWSYYFSSVNQSVWGSAARWLGQEVTSPVQLLVFAGMGLIALAVIIRLGVRTAARGQSPEFAALATLSPWLLLTQLLHPYNGLWGSVFVAGIPFVAAESRDRRSPWYYGVLWGVILILWLLQHNSIVQLLGFSHWSEFAASGLITLYWLALLFVTL